MKLSLLDEALNPPKRKPKYSTHEGDDRTAEVESGHDYNVEAGDNTGRKSSEGGDSTDVAGQDVVSPAQQLIDELKKARAQNRSDIEGLMGSVGPQYAGLSADATAATRDNLAGFTGAANDWHDPALSRFVGGYNSQAAQANGGRSGAAAQRDALSKLQGWTDVAVTPQEKFLEEQARQGQERDNRAAMDAQLANLEARGARSGGSEIEALLGTQRMTSNNRMMQDLGTQAAASQRALQATGMYGDLGSQVRGQGFQESLARGNAADTAQQFNRTLRSEFDARQDTNRIKLADDKWGRIKDVYEGGREATGDAYGYGVDPLKFQERATAMKTGQYTGDTNSLVGGQKFMIGEKDARDAADKLSEDKGLFGLGVFGL